VDLRYRAAVRIGDLELDECTVRHTRDTAGRAWWMLWTWVRRDDTGEPFYVGVPVHPGGGYLEVGPSGARTWGLTRIADTPNWQIAPSIDVVGDLRPDGSRGPSLWHQTPRIVGVPLSEPWTLEAP
jgi:hypothetical protein